MRIEPHGRLNTTVQQWEHDMAKQKRKLTPAEKAEKKRRQREYMTIFINGKQKRVKREPTIDGMPVDEFIRRNADPIWLLQNGMYEELHQWELERAAGLEGPLPKPARDPDESGHPEDDPFELG